MFSRITWIFITFTFLLFQQPKTLYNAKTATESDYVSHMQDHRSPINYIEIYNFDEPLYDVVGWRAEGPSDFSTKGSS